MNRTTPNDLNTVVKADYGVDGVESYTERISGDVHIVWKRPHAGGEAFHSVTIKHDDIPLFAERLLATYLEVEEQREAEAMQV